MSGRGDPEVFAWRGQTVRWGRIGDGPPLVLLHGTPFWSYEWHRVAPHLARGRTVYWYDMPGYGVLGKRDGQDVSLGVQNAVAAALFAHWGLDGARRGGARLRRSDGAAGASARRRRLPLADPDRPGRDRALGLAARARMCAPTRRRLPVCLPTCTTPILAAYLQSAMHRPADDAALAPYMRPWQGDEQRAFYRQIAQMDVRYTDEIEGRLDAIRCPVQLLWGEEDGWIPLAQGRRLARCSPARRSTRCRRPGT